MIKYVFFLLLSLSQVYCQIVTLGDDYPIFLTINTSVRSTSNLYNVDEKVSEVVSTVSPSLLLDLSSKASNLSLTASANTNIKYYASNDNLDKSYPRFSSNASYSFAKSSISSSVSFAQMASEGDDPKDDGEAGRLIARDMTNFSVSGSHQLSEKLSFQTGYNFSRTDYVSGGASLDRDSFSVPLTFYYNYSPKSAIGIGYNYSKEQYDETNDSVKGYYYIKLKGEIFPKLLANSSIGYTDFDNKSDQDGTLGTDLSFTHLYSAKASFVLSLNRQFSPRATGDDVLDTSLTLSGNYSFSAVLSGSASGNYRVSKYSGSKDRKDNSRSFNASLNYRLTPKASISGSLSQRKNTSEGANEGGEYNSQELTLSANFRF